MWPAAGLFIRKIREDQSVLMEVALLLVKLDGTGAIGQYALISNHPSIVTFLFDNVSLSGFRVRGALNILRNTLCCFGE
jgi:hypothetical protein